MGCRVNGRDETDDADLSDWCGPKQAHPKRQGENRDAFGYYLILDRMKVELDELIAVQHCCDHQPAG
jgi:hypothetical protein